MRSWGVLGVLVLAGSVTTSPPEKGAPMVFEIRSPAFEHGGSIPPRFTCDGEDVSPALAWSGVPENARSLALVVDDPDAPDPAAPRMTWVHWVLYDLPPSAAGLPEAADAKGLPKGAREGLNDWKKVGWGGPCPPKGRHRYFFKLYALDVVLGDLKKPSKATLEKAMQGHVVAKSELMGRYERRR